MLLQCNHVVCSVWLCQAVLRVLRHRGHGETVFLQHGRCGCGRPDAAEVWAIYVRLKYCDPLMISRDKERFRQRPGCSAPSSGLLAEGRASMLGFS